MNLIGPYTFLFQIFAILNVIAFDSIFKGLVHSLRFKRLDYSQSNNELPRRMID